MRRVTIILSRSLLVIYLWIEEVGREAGGEGGIRTPDSLTTMPDFESGAFNRALPTLRLA